MKSKKSLLVILLILVIGVVGLTLAYFANTSSIDNVFTTQPYGTTVEEVFTAPSNWLPGDTTNKTITATNTGNVDEAVRISLTESWTPQNSGSTLNGWIHADGTKSTHTTESELANDERVAIINLANTSDWTKVGNYYYYNYKLAPNETTSSLIESVTFNSKTKLDDTCTTTTNGSTKTITCNSSGVDYDDATYTLTFTVETVQYNKYNEAWNLNNTVTIASMKPMNASQLALKSNPVSVTNYTDGNVHEMYTFNHEATEQTPALTDYRYIGNDPYNYVYFNCDSLDNQNSDTCEVWRIIGVFDVERTDPNDNTKTITERRMKLVRGNALSETMAWNTFDSSDWTTSTLNDFLNNDYYNSTNNLSYGLKNNMHYLIDNAKYYLGGHDNSDNFGSAEEIYKWERGNQLCESCENDSTKLSWIGKIALMYPSDQFMVYSNGIDNQCYLNPNPCALASKGWIHKSNVQESQINPTSTWLLSPSSDNIYISFYANGALRYDYAVSVPYAVRPVLYLSSNVKITDGTGEQNNPYKLGL